MDGRLLARRSFLAAAPALALGMKARATRAAPVPAPGTREGEAHLYPAARSEAEWRALLTPTEYEVLRAGRTEFPFSSPLWNETRPGLYRCRACGLPLFDAEWKVPIEKGWLFFRQARADALLMRPESLPAGLSTGSEWRETVLEVHCRRCASHIGHILPVEGDFLHCVNGTGLRFAPASA